MTPPDEKPTAEEGTPIPAERQDLETLYRLAYVVHSFTDLQPLLENLVDLAIQHLNAERGVIFLLNPQGELYPTVARSLYPDELVDVQRVALSVVHATMRSGEGILSENAQSDPRFESESAIHYNILSVLCMPLQFAGTTLGALYVDHGKRPGAFTERDHKFLKSFVDLASSAIKSAQEKETYRLENTYLRQMASQEKGFPEIISNSPKIISILETVDLVAASNVSVLVVGESGTGKELIARAIHFKSARREKKFVAQNCASLPESLLESELFGYKKGSYTGASHDKPGLFEVADGGTLFLDEIGDLSLSSQAKILRALQEGEIRRLGDNKPRKVDVRILSATNKDLQEQIQKGLFREDLFYRLNVVTIKLPPLRDRKEDIPLLARHFLTFYGSRMGRRHMGFEKEALEMLCAYAWPGNVRQLKNEMERLAILLGDGETVAPVHLSEVIQQAAVLGGAAGGAARLRDSLEAIQRKMLLEALQKYHWNKTRAAEELGVTRRGLIKMIERFDLDRRRRPR
ncbi:MAG: sigma 54-interacting transcriptional regulator [Acidobacteriota bacterium]